MITVALIWKYIQEREVFKAEIWELSEQRQAAESLRVSEERFRMLFNEANDAIYVLKVTPDGRYSNFVEFNDNLCRLLGYTEDELRTFSLKDILSPEAMEEASKSKVALFAQKHLVAERLLLSKNGDRIPVEVSSRLFHINEEPTILTIVRDITERKRSEEMLRQSEEKYRQLSQEFDSLSKAINDSLVLLSPEMKIIWTNNGKAYHIEAPVPEIVGRYCYELFYDRAKPCDDCPVVRSFQSGNWETQTASSLSGRYLEKRAFPIRGGLGVENVILVISDVTEKIKMQADAMQASHMASLGELAAGVAHEINNPINGIINYAQVLINECPAGSMEEDIGKRILKEGERTAGIVRSLLSFARGSFETKSLTRIEDVLKESLSLTQAQIRKDGITLITHFPEDLPWVEANFNELQQVFLNIINNARYAIQEKYPGRDENKVIEIHGKKVMADGIAYVETTFYDRGMGIPADKVPMLIMPFFSTKPIGKGTGLGLAIAHRIIQDHGGRMNFESVEGEFTRVIIQLPAKEK